MDERAARIAENEAIFRDLNEEVGAVAHSFSAGGEDRAFDFLCECGDPGCAQRVPVTLVKYEELRSSPLRFVVVPGHEIPDVERVVETTDAYNVIEKFGEAAGIARDRDPRRPAES
jgi:hypothetical protein